MAGYVKLIQGQPYLFQMGAEWLQKARFKAGTQVFLTDLAYDAPNRQVNFNLPINLTAEMVYKVELINLPASAQGAIDKNVSTKIEDRNIAPDQEVKITGKEATGSLVQLEEKPMFSIEVRNSKYKTLSAKLLARSSVSSATNPIGNGVHVLYGFSTIQEIFSLEERDGEPGKYAPLIQVEVDIAGTNWLVNSVFPLVYDSYPLGTSGLNRDINDLGLVPIKAVYFAGYTPTSFTAGLTGAVPAIQRSFNITYNLASYVKSDFFDLKAKLFSLHNANLSGAPARAQQIMTANSPVLGGGNHQVNVRYVLPGNLIRSTTPITIYSSMP